jgi:hypothetical protein
MVSQSSNIAANVEIGGYGKTFSIIAHLCSEMAVFGQKSAQILPSGKPDRSNNQEQSMP